MSKLDKINLEDIKKSLKSDLDRYDRWMSTPCLTSANHVIGSKSGNVYYSPEIKEGAACGKVDFFCNPLDATKFSKRDSQRIAPKIKNHIGHRVGVAVGLYDAVLDARKKTASALDSLDIN